MMEAALSEREDITAARRSRVAPLGAWLGDRAEPPRRVPRIVRQTGRERLVTPPTWINAASIRYLAGVAQPDSRTSSSRTDEAFLAVRHDAIGWLAGKPAESKLLP